MKRATKRWLPWVGAVLTGLLAMPVYAADYNAAYSWDPPAAAVTGQPVTLTLRCDATDLPIAGASFFLQMDSNCVLQSVKAGSDVEGGEISYSYQDGVLRIIYLDNDGGQSALQSGGAVVAVTLVPSTSGTTEPMTNLESETAAISGDDVVMENTTLGSVQLAVSGETVAVPTAPPQVSQEGGTPTEIPAQAETPPQNSSAPAASAAPAAGTAPADGTAPAQGTAPANGAAPAQGTAPQDATAPVPTTLVTIGENGEEIRTLYEGAPDEAEDVTEKVLSAAPAATPTPEESAAAAAEAAKAEQKSPLPLIVAILLVAVAAAAGALVWWRKKK